MKLRNLFLGVMLGAAPLFAAAEDCAPASLWGPYAYVPHPTTQSLSVINLRLKGCAIPDGGTVVEVQVGNGPSAVAVAPGGHTVFVANTDDGTVSVLRAPGHTVTTTFYVGKQPTALALSPDGVSLYVANRGDGSISIVDTRDLTKTPVTVLLDGSPDHVLATPDGSTVYVLSAAGKLWAVDVASRAVRSVLVGVSAQGMDVDDGVLYVAVGNGGVPSATNIVSVTSSDFTPHLFADGLPGAAYGFAVDREKKVLYLATDHAPDGVAPGTTVIWLYTVKINDDSYTATPTPAVATTLGSPALIGLAVLNGGAIAAVLSSNKIVFSRDGGKGWKWAVTLGLALPATLEGFVGDLLRPDLRVEPSTPIVWGPLAAGEHQEQIFTLTNVDSLPVPLQGVEVAGEGFERVHSSAGVDCAGVVDLDPGAHCQATIRYTASMATAAQTSLLVLVRLPNGATGETASLTMPMTSITVTQDPTQISPNPPAATGGDAQNGSGQTGQTGTSSPSVGDSKTVGGGGGWTMDVLMLLIGVVGVVYRKQLHASSLRREACH